MVSWLTRRWSAGTPWRVHRKDRELLSTVQLYTMSEPIRLATLHQLALEVCTNEIVGDVVECGVCNGGSAAIMASAIVQCPERSVGLYDTFEGMPPAGQFDGSLAQTCTGQFIGSIDNVTRVLEKV